MFGSVFHQNIDKFSQNFLKCDFLTAFVKKIVPIKYFEQYNQKLLKKNLHKFQTPKKFVTPKIIFRKKFHINSSENE